jgi:pyrroline-5-carboxylate reductase
MAERLQDSSLMKATIGMVGEGRIGHALAGLEGVTAGVSLVKVSRQADAILVEGESALALEGVRAAVGPEPALLRVVSGPADGHGAGLVVLCPEPGTPTRLVDSVAHLLAEIGVVEVVSEDTFSAAAAVTCSSLGFITVALEGIEEGAVEAGLPRGTARAFVRQTLLATALLLEAHPGSPADLKDQVASPGGTTIAGLAALEDRAARGAFIRAVEEETKRRAETVRRGQVSHD